MPVVCRTGSTLSCALIAIGIAGSSFAIVAPYAGLVIVLGPQDAVYLVIVLSLFLVFRRKRRVAGVLSSLICGILLCFPLSTFIAAINGEFVTVHPAREISELFGRNFGELIYRFVYSVGFLLVLDHLLRKLSWRTP